MTILDSLIRFARDVRTDRSANPRIGGDGSGLELLIAPRFRTLLEAVLPEISASPPRVIPEYERRGVGRPDLAFAREGQPARAFIELKEPGRSLEPRSLRGHDADQFRRFGDLPLWGFCNFTSIKLFQRDELVDQAEILPPSVLDPDTSDAAAARLLADHSTAAWTRVLQALASADAPIPRSPLEVAQVLAHAARLVRGVVAEHCAEGIDAVVANVRADFNETLFARAEAGGYDAEDFDALFASAFAQTLLFGLLLARDASGREVGAAAHEQLPNESFPLLRGTLRALTMEEVRRMLGFAYDLSIDAVNSIDSSLLEPRDGRDPVLYLYEDFLRVFDPEAVARYGVYYTPPEVVKLIVAETDRALRNGLGADGLLDRDVNLLDPACGTGTFLIAATSAVAERARQEMGPGAVAAEVSAFAQRMHGFELLVGPYTVAHYRMRREVAAHRGTAGHLPIFLTDTLAPPATQAGVEPHLAFLSAPIVAERQAADRVKRGTPILVVFGNPPYKRLRSGEVARLIGPSMNSLWQDLKQPVRDAGLGRALNAFPDLYVAFYRWALWRLFEVDGALGRGVLVFITNRGFLTGSGFGGLRQMLRRRFDRIRIIDLRGDNRGARPATVAEDENVFNIEVGVCILIGYSAGEQRPNGEATVTYADVWRERAFNRADKLALAVSAAADPARLSELPVHGTGMERLKPKGFEAFDWPAVRELFVFRSNGLVTYRDDFSYAPSRHALSTRIQDWHDLSLEQARRQFKDSAANTTVLARAVPFSEIYIDEVNYRPFDIRSIYKHPRYVDRLRPELQSTWRGQNIGLICLGAGTGAGPAIWCIRALPDQHAFRGSFGGWVFPLRDHAREGAGHYLAPELVAGLTAAYGRQVEPQDTFDAILALLSATAYTTRFAHDLEDDFPHVPFPADPSVFEAAARIGSRIRLLQGFAANPNQRYRQARIVGEPLAATLDPPPPRRAFTPSGSTGHVVLRADQSLRVANVSLRAWQFSVSGYEVLYRWIKARQGVAVDADLLRNILDVIARIEELVDLCDEADPVLDAAVGASLTRAQLGLVREPTSEAEDEDAPE